MIDVDLAMLNGNTAAFRKSEDDGFIQGFNKTFTDTLIYGDVSTNPEQFNGLNSRYYSLSGEATSAQVISAGGGTTNNTSIYLIGWGPNKVFCTYPKGSKAGLQFEDRGIQDILVSLLFGGLHVRLKFFSRSKDFLFHPFFIRKGGVLNRNLFI